MLCVACVGCFYDDGATVLRERITPRQLVVALCVSLDGADVDPARAVF